MSVRDLERAAIADNRGALQVTLAYAVACGAPLRFAHLPEARAVAGYRKEVERGVAGGEWIRLAARVDQSLVAGAAASGARVLLTLDTRTDSPADPLYRRCRRTPLGIVPCYAHDPDARLSPCTFFHERRVQRRNA